MRLFSGRLLKNLKLCLLSVPLDIIINAVHFILLFVGFSYLDMATDKQQ